MITELRLRNFKGFSGSHSAGFAPITLVYGPNSAGKSALLQGLGLLSQSMPSSPGNVQADEPLTFTGRFVDLGDFQGVVNGHNRSKLLGLGVSYGPAAGNVDPALHQPARSLRSRGSFDVYFRGTSDGVEIPRFEYLLDSEFEYKMRFQGSRSTGEGHSPTTFVLDRGSGIRKLLSESLDAYYSRASASAGTGRPVQDRLKIAEALRALRDTRLMADGFLPGRLAPESLILAEEAVERPQVRMLSRLWEREVARRSLGARTALSTLQYLGPLREAPKRIEQRTQGSGGFVGVGGEDTSFILFRDPELTRRVNSWLQRLEIPYSLQVERLTPRGVATVGEILTLVLRDTRTDVQVSPKDVGFGISQVLPVVTQCLAGGSSTLLIEQPEIHLHPRLQANIADLFLESTLETGPGPDQIIAETHSESLLLRIQKRIREGKVQPKAVRILYVGNSAGLGSWIREIGIDEKGEFTAEWPDGFFEERFEELVV